MGNLLYWMASSKRAGRGDARTRRAGASAITHSKFGSSPETCGVPPMMQKNVLVRRLDPGPAGPHQQLQISITVSNKPTEQYEQVDLVWYYDDSHMVKIGQEL